MLSALSIYCCLPQACTVLYIVQFMYVCKFLFTSIHPVCVKEYNVCSVLGLCTEYLFFQQLRESIK